MKQHPRLINPDDWPERILVAEDDEGFLSLMSDFFTQLGIPFTLAEDGREAIEILEQESFPLIFTDMNMPKVDGLQLLAHIKSRSPETDVIAMTGYSEEYGLVDAIRAGATDYMTKPFTLEELKAKIVRVTRARFSLGLFQQEIAKRRYSERNLSQKNNTLLAQIERQKDELLETNAALRLILRQRDMEKDEAACDLAARYQKEIAPFLEKLKHTTLHDVQRHYLDVATMNLESVFLPTPNGKSYKYQPFTETETKIVNLMKQQKTSKDIAAILQVSLGTIRTHRENIRKKLQITNTKKNLYKTIISIP